MNHTMQEYMLYLALEIKGEHAKSCNLFFYFKLDSKKKCENTLDKSQK